MYKYEEVGQKNIFLIKCLWNKNRDVHIAMSKFFSGDYSGLNFEQRMKALFAKLEKIKVTVAKDKDKMIVAYCLSVIDGSEGEVATLYVDERHRKNGIAKNLLNIHIEWMKKNQCSDIIVNVLSNNDSAIKLYKNMGFKEDILKMRIVVN